MAKKLELSDPHVVALMGQHKKLIPWRSAAYDDETTLLELRTAHPRVEWSLIRDMFNEAVPCKRKRSMDSIKNKWRVLRAKSRITSQAAPAEQTASEGFIEDSTIMPAAPVMQMNPEGNLESQYNTVTEGESITAPAKHTLCDASIDNQYGFDMVDQSIVSLDTLNQNFADYYEMISTYWDSMADFDGYVASIANELERMEAAKMVAIQAASGFHV